MAHFPATRDPDGRLYCSDCLELMPAGAPYQARLCDECGPIVRRERARRDYRGDREQSRRRKSREAILEYQRRYREAHRDARREYDHQRYWGENGEAERARLQRYRGRPAVRARRREQERQRRQENPHLVALCKARRQFREFDQCPVWAGELTANFEAIYAEAREMGPRYEVDHMAPLAGCRDCGVVGLHVPWNLQIISATENSAKHNRCVDCWEIEKGRRVVRLGRAA